MHTPPEVPSRAARQAQANLIVNVAATVCGLGMIAFICVATSGLDISVGFF